MVDYRQLTTVLAEFAHDLVAGYGVGDILHQLGDHAVALLPVSGAGVMLFDQAGDLRFASATDERTTEVERLQTQHGEGPCLAAAQGGQRVIAADLQAGDSRFPQFAYHASQQGMRAVFAFPMTVATDERIGGLNLYRDRPGKLANSDADAAQVLANVASAYIIHSRNLTDARQLAEQLQAALDTRVIIEQAKGRLVGELEVEPGTAFELLRSHSRSSGHRIHDAARQVVDGTLSAARLVEGRPD